MIRKILFFIILAYTIAWFVVAYIIKINIVSLIKNSESDNIKISYDHIKCSGYPTNWQVNIVEPKVKWINCVNTKEISTKKLSFVVDFSLKKATLVLGQELKYNESFDNKIVKYIIHSNQNIQASVKFNHFLYKLSNQANLKSITQSLQLNNKLLSINCGEKEIFNITDLAATMINKVSSVEDEITAVGDEKIRLQLCVSYNDHNNFIKFKKAKLDLTFDWNLTHPYANSGVIPNKIIFDHLALSYYDDSEINVTGTLWRRKKQTSLNDSICGKLSFALINCHNVVNNLSDDMRLHNHISNYWLLSSTEVLSSAFLLAAIEKIEPSLTATTTNHDIQKINKNLKFDVECSDEGALIKPDSSTNLFELPSEHIIQ